MNDVRGAVQNASGKVQSILTPEPFPKPVVEVTEEQAKIIQRIDELEQLWLRTSDVQKKARIYEDIERFERKLTVDNLRRHNDALREALSTQREEIEELTVIANDLKDAISRLCEGESESEGDTG